MGGLAARSTGVPKPVRRPSRAFHFAKRIGSCCGAMEDRSSRSWRSFRSERMPLLTIGPRQVSGHRAGPGREEPRSWLENHRQLLHLIVCGQYRISSRPCRSRFLSSAPYRSRAGCRKPARQDAQIAHPVRREFRPSAESSGQESSPCAGAL